jgi:hypothetical protein
MAFPHPVAPARASGGKMAARRPPRALRRRREAAVAKVFPTRLRGEDWFAAPALLGRGSDRVAKDQSVMHAICAYLSSAVGLVAAGLWFWASRIEVPTNLSTLFDHDMIAGLGPMRAGFARVAVSTAGLLRLRRSPFSSRP